MNKMQHNADTIDQNLFLEDMVALKRARRVKIDENRRRR